MSPGSHRCAAASRSWSRCPEHPGERPGRTEWTPTNSASHCFGVRADDRLGRGGGSMAISPARAHVAATRAGGRHRRTRVRRRLGADRARHRIWAGPAPPQYARVVGVSARVIDGNVARRGQQESDTQPDPTPSPSAGKLHQLARTDSQGRSSRCTHAYTPHRARLHGTSHRPVDHSGADAADSRVHLDHRRVVDHGTPGRR